jgi:rubrerythrin
MKLTPERLKELNDKSIVALSTLRDCSLKRESIEESLKNAVNREKEAIRKWNEAVSNLKKAFDEDACIEVIDS